MHALNDEPAVTGHARALRSIGWMRIGECVTAGDVGFFSDRGSNLPAKRVCALCPVRDDCLGYALELEIDYGVWGGTTPAERKRLLRRDRGRAAGL
jgi:WhiB family transcriptional regulator, redox-sensing transcriptional regulator